MEGVVSLRERIVEYAMGAQLPYYGAQGPFPPGGRHATRDTGKLVIFFKREDADLNKITRLSPTRGAYEYHPTMRQTPQPARHYAPPPPPPNQAPPQQAPPPPAPHQQAHVQPPVWDQEAQDRFEAEVRARVQLEMMQRGGQQPPQNATYHQGNIPARVNVVRADDLSVMVETVTSSTADMTYRSSNASFDEDEDDDDDADDDDEDEDL